MKKHWICLVENTTQMSQIIQGNWILKKVQNFLKKRINFKTESRRKDLDINLNLPSYQGFKKFEDFVDYFWN